MWQAEYGLGAGWGNETHRAAVLTANPLGQGLRNYATGIRNCAGLSMHPTNGDLWCTVNERDDLGDDLAPDYSTRVKAGQFYGWPWYYTGSHAQFRVMPERPDLAGRSPPLTCFTSPIRRRCRWPFHIGGGAGRRPKAGGGG